MEKLVRTLGLKDLVLLLIGGVIGSGIFLVPGAILKQVGGSPGLALLVWAAGGLLSLLGALTFAELSVRRPEAGGLYVFIRDAFGRLPAFLFGWTMFFTVASGTVATLAVAFGTYLAEFVPMGEAGRKAAAVGVILAVTVVNVAGTRRSADVQNWTTIAKLGALALMSALLLWLGRAPAAAGAALPFEGGSVWTGFGAAMVSVLWAYEGWQYITFSAGEVVDPQRRFPRAFVGGLLVLTAVYLLVNAGYHAALGPGGVLASERVAADALGSVLGPRVGDVVTLAILLSIFSCANATVLTSPRIFYAMGEDGLFFRRMGRVHPRFGTPAAAIIGGSLWASVLALSGTFEQLLTYVVFSGWLFYGMAGASIFVYRRRSPEPQAPYRVPGYPWTPLLFVLASAALVANTIFVQPVEALAGLGILLSGIPAYAVWRTRSGMRAGA